MKMLMRQSRHLLGKVLGKQADRPADIAPAAALKWITIDQLDEVAEAFLRNDRAAWEGCNLALPNWFDLSIDPNSPDYRAQILKLWAVITGRSDYDPAHDEDTPEIADIDPVLRPAHYATGDVHFAGGQIMATGHILMRSDIKPGNRVLEYGAGFGQTALAFARMGAKVDTVDVNPAFCNAVRKIADHYQVELAAHEGQFGHNPAGKPNAYDLILFYESFHHCLDFDALVARLPSLLTPDGKIILAGEPIFEGPVPGLPYAWGPRLDWECLAVMRIRGWMELGFQDRYLLEKFRQAGFSCTFHRDPNSHWAQVYEFRQEQPSKPSRAAVAI